MIVTDPARAEAAKVALDQAFRGAQASAQEIADGDLAISVANIGRWVEVDVIRSDDPRIQVGDRIELAYWDGSSANAQWAPHYVDQRRMNLVTKAPDGAILSGFIMVAAAADGSLHLQRRLVNA